MNLDIMNNWEDYNTWCAQNEVDPMPLHEWIQQQRECELR